MPRQVRLWGALILLFTVCTCLNAQDVRGRIQGFVTDSSRAAVPGATVTLTNVKTQVTVTRSTTEAGLYRFDAVDPGTYSITVELAGFKKFTQENFEIQARADLTINAALSVGEITEQVVVEGNAVQLAFNTSDAAMTIDYKLTAELPRFDRNPFKLTLLMPAAVETRRNEQNPFNSWSANSVELGGGTNLKNNLMIDGSPVGVGYKVAWVPNADAVQEANVDKSAVDASFGHSAGGTISMATKAGTNEYHGSLFWLGRQPNLNAVTNRTTGVKSAAKNNIYGASVGHPILKNKLFNFFSWEAQKPRSPSVGLKTVPTDLEKQGDFSQSKNRNGGLLTIYDPYTTTFDPATGKVTRQAFSGNKIPSSRFDSLGALWMSQLLSPNRTPDDITGTNNFSAVTNGRTNYYDISDRVDWNLNKSLRIFARPSIYRTTVVSPSPAQEVSPLYIQGGSKRNGYTIAGEAMWTVSPSTVASFRGDARGFLDEYHSIRAGDDVMAKYWPNNSWFAPFAYPKDLFPVYMPGVNFTGKTGANMGAGSGTLWSQHPSGWSMSTQLSQMRNQHYLKAGFEHRRQTGWLLSVNGNQFTFDPALTADTFQSPNTALVGNAFATLLLGAINDTSQAVAAPLTQNRTEFYAAYIQDDWKPTRWLTLNLGLRWELETPWHDPGSLYQQSIGPDFTKPTPGVSSAPPTMPAAATSMLNVPYSWTGAWQFTSKDHPGIWEYQKLVLMPRLGAAMRVNDKTSLRFGYARYVVPSTLGAFMGPPFAGYENLNTLQPIYPGYDKQQQPLPLANGIPQAIVSNPFPAGVNPLTAPTGNAAGAVMGLGYPNIGWGGDDYKRSVNDRFNLSLSRQLPNRIIVEAAFFTNLSHDLAYSWNFNQVDPRIIYQYKAQTAVTVANPFYNYLTPAQFPGSMRNLKTVPLSNLLVQRPQYGGLWEVFKPGAKEQYYSLDLKIQRQFANGYNFMVGYSYIREKTQARGAGTGDSVSFAGTGAFYLDALDAYNNNLTYLDSPNPHHRATVAGTYQLPFGKGRKLFGSAPRALDAIFGGWQVLGSWYFNSGSYLRFGSAQVTGDPSLANPTLAKWFNTDAFKVLPSYTPRTNPDHYPNIRGPLYWEMQASLSKQVAITERVKFELKGAAYNLTNRLNWANPDLTITSSTFGRVYQQAGSVTGRQIEMGAKLIF